MKYGIDELEISECRWAGFGRRRTRTGETLLYSGKEDDAHLSGVTMMLSKKAPAGWISWSSVNESSQLGSCRVLSEPPLSICIPQLMMLARKQTMSFMIKFTMSY